MNNNPVRLAKVEEKPSLQEQAQYCVWKLGVFGRMLVSSIDEEQPKPRLRRQEQDSTKYGQFKDKVLPWLLILLIVFAIILIVYLLVTSNITATEQNMYYYHKGDFA